jgi:rSAM/selenodomain-associated transferase 1
VRRLIILVKAPRLGKVKTRLARDLGGEGALLAYKQMTGALISNLFTLKEVQILYSPADARAEIHQWLQPGWNASPQAEGDLGERLVAAFENAFSKGCAKVLIIGSDCPYVTREDIDRSWELLESSDLVLGPTLDGGYWLIGLRKSEPDLFRDIPWSTNAVLGETIKRAKAMGLKVSLMRNLEDIDTVKEWERFENSLRVRITE